ncbi:MAG: hypothetical protein ABIH00_10630 [Armatimonadota bacterium]
MKNNRVLFLFLFLFIIVAAVIMTYPLVLHLPDGVVDLPEDQLLTSWIINWDIKAFLSNPLGIFDTNIFYPEKNTLAYSDTMFTLAFFASPFLYLSGNPLFAHNVLLLFSFVFTFFSMYFMMDYFLKDKAGAAVAGIAFTFTSYTLAHINHLSLIWIGFIPLTVLYLDIYLREGKIKDLSLMLLFYAFQFFTAFYYAFYLALVIFIYVIIFKFKNSGILKWKYIKGLIIGFLILFFILSPVIIQYMKINTQDTNRISLDSAVFYSTDIKDFACPGKFNKVYTFFNDRFGSEYFPWEHSLFPGFILIFLALWGAFSKPKTQSPFIKMFFIITALITFIMVLGPYLKIFGKVVYIKLPFYYLHQFIPGFNNIRAPAHFGIFLFFSLAALAGAGFYNLTSGFRYKNLFAVIFIILICFENFSAPLPVNWVQSKGSLPKVVTCLSSLEDNAVLVHMPMYYTIDRAWIYMSMYHGRKIINGHSGQNPQWYDSLSRFVNTKISDPRCIDFLKRWGVDYIVFHFKRLPPDYAEKVRTRLLNNKNLKLIFKDDNDKDYVFKIIP